MSQFDSAAEKLDLPKILSRIQFYASSELGKDAAVDIEPMTDFKSIAREHNLVSEMKSLLEGDSNVPIDGIKDIRSAIQKATIENSVLSAKELLDIALTMQVARNLKSFIGKKNEYLPELTGLTYGISIFKEIELNVFQSIDDSGEVKDTASKQLRSIRQSIIDKQIVIRKTLERILRATSEQGIAQEEIITTRDGRMVIPIKSELKNKFPGFIHSTSSSGHTVYIEPSETLTLNNEITDLYYQEKREVERILRQLTYLIHGRIVELRNTIIAVTHLDLTFAKAMYSLEIKGNAPFLKLYGSLYIETGYHPILLLRHQRETILPLTIELGKSFNTILISGPNAGGKTVALKSVGILSLMVQSGIHIPASPDSQFPIFNKIFVLIGDNQSIENDLSTYSSQVLQIKNITENADNKSLILIDEIGSNTDPSEGGAFGAAVLNHLNETGALTIATSHQAALKAFVHSKSKMENGAMEFDQVTLLPTYKFRIGIPGSSYALEIAQRFGIREEIVRNAREMLGDQKVKVEQLIYDLENQSRNMEQKIAEANANAKKSKELSALYESKLTTLKNDIRNSKKQAMEEASLIVKTASSTIESVIKEIRDQNASTEIIKESRTKINELETQIISIENELSSSDVIDISSSLQIEIGDLVVLKSGGQTGIVLTLPDKKGILQVAFNSIKAKVNITNIESVAKRKSLTNDIIHSYSISKQVSTEVDVRGLFGDDAVTAVDKFLDDALLAGLQRVDIIHGKGTGALRKKINFFLEKDMRVKSIRIGEWNEGGTGVTVVELG